MDANAPRRGGSGGPRFGGGAVVAAVVALVAVVAIASSGSAPSGSVGARRPSQGMLDTFFSLFVVMMAVGAVAVVVMLSFFGRYTPGAEGGRRRSTAASVLTFVVAVCLLAILIRVVTGSDGNRGGLLPGGPGAGSGGSEAAPAGGYEPEFAVWPVLGVGALVLVVVVAWWLSARGRRSARPPAAWTPEEALADVLAATLDDLRDEGDPRRAVIGAYARMERSLAAVGLPRGRAEAPEEYLERVLGGVDVSERAAARLTALFAWARFSGHDVEPEMKDEAIDTLEQMQRELAAAEAEREARLAGVLA